VTSIVGAIHPLPAPLVGLSSLEPDVLTSGRAYAKPCCCRDGLCRRHAGSRDGLCRRHAGTEAVCARISARACVSPAVPMSAGKSEHMFRFSL